jgi:NADPH-dependent 2,4-dienoyl-CoA reductase/sulfur reductase-like enzyme
MNGHLGAAATAYLVVTSLILHPSSLVILPQHGSCKITTCKLNMSILPKGNNIMSSKVGIQKRIAVIGGGAAGIITADVMVDSGFAVTVFEQSDAVGGVWDYRSQGEVMLNI